jgi:RHS repeat-associated protein
MKMKINSGRFGLLLALLFVALQFPFGPSAWVLSPSKYWVGNAVASLPAGTPSTAAEWDANPTADGVGQTVINPGRCGEGVAQLLVLTIGTNPDDCINQLSAMSVGTDGLNPSACCVPDLLPFGWSSAWSGVSCTFNYYCEKGNPEYGTCMYPSGAGLTNVETVQQLNLEPNYGLLGSSCPFDVADAGPAVSNRITGNSSIDLKGGNVYHSQHVGPLTFSYNSLDSTTGPLGIGWTHDFNVSIITNTNGSLYLRQGDGSSVLFSPSGSVYYPDAMSRDTSTIVKNTNGSYTRTTRYGKVYNFNSSGQLTSIVDRNGNTTTLTYTGNNLTGITDSTGRTIVLGVSGGKIISVTDFSGKTSTISYSAAGLISSIADPLGNTWNFQYDSNNRMVQKTDPSGNTSSYTYDATTGMLTSSTDPNNMVISVAYNTANGISTVTEKDGGVWIHQYNTVFNVPLVTTDPYGNKTTYAYDSNNNLLSITYPDGTSKSFTYDANRNVLSVTDAGGRTTTLTYNSQNRVTAILDPSGGTTNITYDAKGNLSSYQDPTGAIRQFQRDSKGNITSVTDPLGHVTQYGYDQYNNVVSVTDPTNVATSFTRDIPGNVLSLKDALNNTTSFVYDADSQLTASADPLGDTASFTFDRNGNRSSVTDPMQNLTTYTYNHRGLPTQRTDALGKITAFSYVDTGCPSCGGGGEKLTSLTDAVGSTTSFAYNQRGLLTSITDPLQKVTSFTYDVNGRPASRTDRNRTLLTYANTPTGKLESITYPDQTQTTYFYDNLDRLTQMSDSIGTSYFGYDADGRITSFTDADNFTFSYLYDAAGNLLQITYPDGSLVTYAYDAANRLLSVTDWLGGQATYAYDQAGRLASFTQFNGIETIYSYDAASRLTGIASNVASYQFTLDGNGNRIGSAENQPLTATPATGGSTVFAYNAQKNRLLSAGALSYTYDYEGQLATAGNTGLVFDYNHRLVGIGTDTQFSYDGRGNRLIATRSGVTTRYIYDPWGNLMADADSNGVTHKYIYGKGLLAIATPSARYCYHFNGTGSTVAITDMSQAVVNSYAYDPFGQILGQQEAITQPFKFVGQYGVMAEPNGLYYMRARYYDPSVGRFISEDPLGFGGGDVNLFAYARNNPVSRIDPFGLKPGDPFATADAAALDAIDFIMPRSISDNLEYGGWVYYNSENGYYSYTEAVAGDERSINVKTFNEPCDGNKKTSIYHTHTGNAYNVGWFSQDDYLISGVAYLVPIYLGTSSGLVRVYDPHADSNSEKTIRSGY